MLRINRIEDYAICGLGQRAQDVGRVRTAAAPADATGVPVPTVSKLLKQMAGAALVNARRGAKGGYSLDRPAAEITVTEIIQALEGPIALTARSEEHTSELQSLMRTSYAVFCLKKKYTETRRTHHITTDTKEHHV